MSLKTILAAAVIAATVAPAFAAEEYYIVQDTKTKKCTIVTERPRDTTIVQIGPLAFKTRTEAEGAYKTTTVCTTN